MTFDLRLKRTEWCSPYPSIGHHRHHDAIYLIHSHQQIDIRDIKLYL
jgi:hypothetical protein